MSFSLYFLGETGLAKTVIISSVLVILQNTLSVSALQPFSAKKAISVIRAMSVLGSLCRNPVILSSLAGISAFGFGLQLPQVVLRFLEMLGSVAPPMALLLIGASLHFRNIRNNLKMLIGAVFAKLLCLPALGLLLFTLFQFSPEVFLTGLLLLACPTAAISYVLATEMKGGPEFIVTTISISTLVSAVSFALWMETALWLNS